MVSQWQLLKIRHFWNSFSSLIHPVLFNRWRGIKKQPNTYNMKDVLDSIEIPPLGFLPSVTPQPGWLTSVSSIFNCTVQSKLSAHFFNDNVLLSSSCMYCNFSSEIAGERKIVEPIPIDEARTLTVGAS